MAFLATGDLYTPYMGNSNKTGHSTQNYTVKIHQQNLQSNSSDHFFLYVIVSITGAAVMMIELMGTRIIGPFYGVSLLSPLGRVKTPGFSW
jgi:hypothetical protein